MCVASVISDWIKAMARALFLRFVGMCGLWLVLIALFHEVALGAATERVAWSYLAGLTLMIVMQLTMLAISSTETRTNKKNFFHQKKA